MITDKDILARLVAGESIDDIMNEITKNVNSALQEKEKLDEEARIKAEEARKAEEAKRQAEEEAKLNKEAKRNAICEIINGVRALATVYGWGEIVEFCDEMTLEDMDDLIDTIEEYAEMFKLYAKIGSLTFPLGGSKPKVEKDETKPAEKKTITIKTPASAVPTDEAIMRFLAGNGLI